MGLICQVILFRKLICRRNSANIPGIHKSCFCRRDNFINSNVLATGDAICKHLQVNSNSLKSNSPLSIDCFVLQRLYAHGNIL